MSTTVGGPPVNQNHTDSINGRNTTIPAIPSSAINGNPHTRNPSMTVTPAGASFNANGGPPQGNTNKIQFGSMNAAGSPAMSTPPLAHQGSNNLGVNSLGPRAASPQGSPSPIPQPVSVSGGRPPSTLQNNGVSFGQLTADSSDPSGLARPLSQAQLGPNQEHMRRSSSQSIHSDIGNQNLPTGPGRGGYPSQGGRGRGSYYQSQMAYSPHQNFRPTQNGRGMNNNYQNQGRHQQNQYQNSPNLGTRSPMMSNVNPGTPQMSQMHMMQGIQGQPGYYMGPQGYGPPTAADPSIQYMSMQNMNYLQQYQSMPNQYGPYVAPPQSPRPGYQQPGYATQMQPTYSNQGPHSMSRQSSQMSATTDRPGSSIGQAPHTPSVVAPHTGARTPSISSQQKSTEFTKPKKNAAIIIKNPLGEVINFKKSATPSTTVPIPSAPVVATPPSRTGSAADHTRAESNAKSDEEKKKAMQEAVTRKVAEENAKAKQEKEAADQKVQMEQEAAQAAEREAESKKAEAEALEKEAQEAEARQAAKKKEEEEAVAAAAATAAAVAKAEAEAEAQKAADTKAKAEAEAEAEAESAKQIAPVDNEPDYDAIEAEYAAIEAEEARIEEEYQKKKTAQKEAQHKKEQEEAAAYEANMKESERKAEEEELAREKRKADGISEDPEAKTLFAHLKAGEGATPTSTADETPAETPAESGTQTPVSDSSMPPPSKSTGSSRKKIADLTLDTKKSGEPAEPSATLKSLTDAKRLDDLSSISYPEGIDSPSVGLNASANGKFKYNTEFLLQFQDVFKEKPTADWDTKIRDALGDGDSSARTGTARTPSGMGGRSASNRPSTGNFPPVSVMGQFGGSASARAPVPPGTTSEQRFAASQAAIRGGPANPFTMGRGSMAPPTGGRTPSNNPFGSMPGTPRPGGQSQRGGRNESKRNRGGHKQEVEQNKSMPLTAGMSIALPEVTSTGWKPRSIGQTQSGPTPGGEGYLEADVVQRKVKAALNKMTPEKFDKIADQVLDIAAQSKHESDGRTLRQVIQLTFEKATDEAHWASMYAMFCGKMLRTMSPDIKDENIKDKNGEIVTGGNLFRKYLLNRCQEEFERGWKVNLPAPEEGETQETVMLSDDYYIAAAAKRRGLGLVKFIGELFKLGMLTERIMHECVKKLVDYEGIPEEAEVESLTSLLRTIGKQLDDPQSKAQGRMDVYFARIQQTMDIPDLPSRLRYMLLDIIDLRRNGWVSKQDDKGPKTIQEIREEAELQAQRAEMQRLAQQANRGGGRMPVGRGDARSFSAYGQAPPPDTSNRVGADDLRRLGGRNSRNPSSTGPSLGPPSLLGGRTNSRRGLGPGSLLSRGGDESNASSRTGTPPIQKDKKDEANTNAFSALAALDGQDSHEDQSSPPTQKSQPSIERERSRSPEKSTE